LGRPTKQPYGRRVARRHTVAVSDTRVGESGGDKGGGGDNEEAKMDETVCAEKMSELRRRPPG
jgi:hypothetical protein